MAFVHIFVACVKNKVLIVFVEGIVRQMHMNILHIFLPHFLVFFCGESSQAFIVYENSQRIVSHDQDIYSEVELEIFDEERVINIGLDNTIFPVERLNFAINFNAFSLSHCFRLVNVVLGFFLARIQILIISHKFSVVRRNAPCEWEKVIFFRKLPVHFHKTAAQEILSCQHIDGREMANLLMFV